jgi:hypothetical protein
MSWRDRPEFCQSTREVDSLPVLSNFVDPQPRKYAENRPHQKAGFLLYCLMVGRMGLSNTEAHGEVTPLEVRRISSRVRSGGIHRKCVRRGSAAS